LFARNSPPVDGFLEVEVGTCEQKVCVVAV